VTKIVSPCGLMCVCAYVWTVSSQPAKYTAGCSNSYFQPIACITKFSNSYTHTHTCTHANSRAKAASQKAYNRK